MKPKTNDPNDPGLLEYLEDIIGSNVYKEQIDNSELELDKIGDQRKEKMERVKISEADLLKLDDAKNIAVDFVKKEKQSHQLMNIQYQIERFKANEEVTKCENDVTELDTKLKAEKKHHKDKVKENEGFLKGFNDLKKEIESNNKTKADGQKKYEELNTRDAKVQNDKKHQLAAEVKTKSRLEDLEKEYHKTIETTAEIEKELPGKQKKLKELQKEKETQEKKLREIEEDLSESTRDLTKKKDKINKDLQPHSKKYGEIKNKLDELTNEHSLLKKKREGAEQDIGEVEKRAEEVGKELEEFKQYSAQIDEALQKMGDMTKERRKELKELDNQETEVMNEIHEVNSRLEEMRSNSGQAKARNQIITELLKAQKNKQLHGICGRLGDLGAIDEMYDIAVSTACPQLDNIVVNRYEEAQRGVEYLRAHRIGRSTFIALDKISWVRDNMTKRFQAPPNSQRLFDLINFKDDSYKPAFYYALRDTLVCRDIDTATQIAYGPVRYRVVTLDGQLIDISGTMSGGGHPKRGGMGHRLNEEVSEEQMNQLTTKTHTLNRRIEEIRKEKQEIDKGIQEIYHDQVQAEKEKSRIKLDLEDRNQEYKESSKKLAELRKILENKSGDKKDLEDLDKQIKSQSKALEEVNKTVGEFKKQLEKIDQEIADIGGKELKDQQQKVANLTKKYEELEAEVSKQEVQVKSVVKSLNQNKKEQLDLKEKMEKIKRALEKLKEEEANLEEEGMKVLGLMKACEEKKKQLEKEFADFDKEHEKIRKLMSELKASIDAISAEREEKNKLLK